MTKQSGRDALRRSEPAQACLSRYYRNIDALEAGDVTVFPALLRDVFTYLTDNNSCVDAEDAVTTLGRRAVDLLTPLCMMQDAERVREEEARQQCGAAKGGASIETSSSASPGVSCLIILCACVMASRMPTQCTALVHGAVVVTCASSYTMMQTACVLFLCCLHWDASYSACILLPCFVFTNAMSDRLRKEFRRLVVSATAFRVAVATGAFASPTCATRGGAGGGETSRRF